MSKRKFRKNSKLGLSTQEAIAAIKAPKLPKPPKPIKPPPIYAPKQLESLPISVIEPELINDNSCNDSDIINLQEALTARELRFLDFHLLGGESADKALIQAGYTGYHQNSLYRLGRSIVLKYERQTEDTKKIFQDIGFGQATIAQGIKEKALLAKSEMVSLNAYQLAARCTRMLEEPQASHQGVNIIINCGTEPAGSPGAPARPVNVLVQGSDLPSKPLQIIK